MLSYFVKTMKILSSSWALWFNMLTILENCSSSSKPPWVKLKTRMGIKLFLLLFKWCYSL